LPYLTADRAGIGPINHVYNGGTSRGDIRYQRDRVKLQLGPAVDGVFRDQQRRLDVQIGAFRQPVSAVLPEVAIP
jgi:hypothetical protein